MENSTGLPAEFDALGRQFQVRWCASQLAMREALCDLEANDELHGLLLVTPLADHQMPADIAARLAKARVFQAKDWEILRPMFGDISIDARLSRYPWMAQALIEAATLAPYPMLISRFLDLDTAWREFLKGSLGLEAARPDGVALFQWSLNPLSQQRLAMLSPAYKAQRTLAARGAPEDSKIRTLLTALDERGGKLSWSALAQRLAMQEMRLPGFLSVARRMLNVDQSTILAIDESARMVELNRPLLERQFGVSP